MYRIRHTPAQEKQLQPAREHEPVYAPPGNERQKAPTQPRREGVIHAQRDALPVLPRRKRAGAARMAAEVQYHIQPRDHAAAAGAHRRVRMRALATAVAVQAVLLRRYVFVRQAERRW